MHKVIFGIFAHPDDEAFGPAGTLLCEKRAGNEVHLICATAGEAGLNPENVPNLAEVRLEEWRHAGELIGADSMHHLGYRDGTLSNDHYLEIAEKIRQIIASATDGRNDIEIELMSMDMNGITGHLDHIAISRISCYVFCTLKEQDARVSRLRLVCASRELIPQRNCEWLYVDQGRAPENIDETIDAREHLDTVRRIMRAHHTQRQDGEAHITSRGDKVAVNHFIVIT